MKINLHELIRVIGKKHGIELSQDKPINQQLTNLEDNQQTLEFAHEINNIVMPLLSKGGQIKLNEVNEITDFIPLKYWEDIHPLNDNNESVMSLSSLEESIKEDYKLDLSNNKQVEVERDRLKAAYIHDEWPVYAGLEHCWNLLSSSEYYNYSSINRTEQPSDNPLSSFAYYTTLGYYPPPELMVMIGTALQTYFSLAGKLSLEEVFFGESYSKTKSFAYKAKMKTRFLGFEISMISWKKKGEKLSIEKAASKFLDEQEEMINLMPRLRFPYSDVETFLRAYRRWKKSLKNGKYD